MMEYASKFFNNSKNIIVTIIYLSMFLDNILLTVVVPIMPDYLLNIQKNISLAKPEKISNITRSNGFKTPIQLEAELMESESAMLLSSKAIIQLLINPVVGNITGFLGYNLPLFLGTLNLLIAALLYAFGESYATLLLARSLQGIASSFISVSGLCLAAKLDTDERNRARTIGFVLGSVALGVLCGYPLGGFLYDFIGKRAPFLVISFIILINLGLQLHSLDLRPKSEACSDIAQTKWSVLLSDPLIVVSAGAIWISTSALTVLEPCLPIWLKEHLNPETWQLGTVFIPDSLGYLIGTNCFGVFAYRFGRWRVAMASMITIGICTWIVPTATSVKQLLIPHFGLGLGIGVIDSALVPLLANLVDTRHHTHYGTVYALQQIAVSLAYSVGPIIGGQLVKVVGFPWVIRTVGIFNFLYSPLLFILNPNRSPITNNDNIQINTTKSTLYDSFQQVIKEEELTEYKRFQNTED